MNRAPIPLFPLKVLATPWQVSSCYHGMALGGRNGLQYGG